MFNDLDYTCFESAMVAGRHLLKLDVAVAVGTSDIVLRASSGVAESVTAPAPLAEPHRVVRMSMLRLLIVASLAGAACKSKPAADDKIVAAMQQRFAKMLESFDTKVPACTSKLDSAQSPLLNWNAFSELAGKPLGNSSDPLSYWPDNSPLGDTISNSYNPPASQRQYAKQIEHAVVIVAKVIRVDNGKGGGATLPGETTTGFQPGTVEARVVEFDDTGRPTCELSVVARNSDTVFAAADQVGDMTVAKDMDKTLSSDLQSNLKSAVRDAVFR